ncbi:MAG: hypothetical protein K9H14_03225 [Actinomycetia bacterium]|nr:hypothetical protein [Actinomycetes bacterium]
MKKFFVILLVGTLVWAVPFATSLLAEPLKETGPFKELKFLALIIAAVFFLVIYFRRQFKGFAGEGFLVGIMWLGICLVLDWLLAYGQGNFGQYFLNQGFLYLSIPIISSGFDLIVKRKLW